MSNKKTESKQVIQNEEASSTQKETRRKVLKNTLLGGAVISTGAALPKKWSKPVLDSVVLPAHASTTDTGDSPITPSTTTPEATTTPQATTTPGKDLGTGVNYDNLDYDIV